MTSFKLGRLPGQVPVGLRELPYYSAGPLPKPPASVTVPQVANFQMLGNGPDPTCTVAPNGVGDCGPVGLIHGDMAAAADTYEAETWPDANQVVDYYLRYTGGQDSGVVLSQFLAYVRKHKFYGHSVAAYAPVAVHDVPTLQFVIDAYDFAYVGITVTQGMMDAAQGPGPWTWDAEAAAGPSIGGHCIILVGYDSAFLYGVTWGQIVKIAYPAWHSMSDEAWAVLPGEISKAGTDGHGINLAALDADLPRLDGDATPAAPAPAPSGPATLLDELASLVRSVAANAGKDEAAVIAWIRERIL